MNSRNENAKKMEEFPKNFLYSFTSEFSFFFLRVKFLFSSLRGFPSTVFFGRGFGIHLEKKASSDAPLKIRRGCCCLWWDAN